MHALMSPPTPSFCNTFLKPHFSPTAYFTIYCSPISAEINFAMREHARVRAMGTQRVRCNISAPRVIVKAQKPEIICWGKSLSVVGTRTIFGRPNSPISCAAGHELPPLVLHFLCWASLNILYANGDVRLFIRLFTYFARVILDLSIA